MLFCRLCFFSLGDFFFTYNVIYNNINTYRHQQAFEAFKVVYEDVIDNDHINQEVRKQFADKLKQVFVENDQIFLSDD